MKQQYQVLRKENDWLYDYVGKEFNRKLLGEAYDRLYKEHGKFGFPGFAKSIVTVTDEHKRILAMGGSSLLKERKTGKIIPDLTMNNFGLSMASIFNKTVNNSTAGTNLTNSAGTTGGNSAAINTYLPQASLFSNDFGHSFQTTGTFHGTEYQVGSGTTAPAKTDFNVETAFGSSPESGPVSGVGESYDSANARIVSDIDIIAGGAGTVNESCYFMRWFPRLGNSVLFLMFHDAITPGVPFIATNTITPSYTLQF